MTDKKLKEKFIEILKFNMLEPTIDPEDGNFEDHLSIQLWKFFTDELAIARAEERERVVEEIEARLMGQNVIFNLVGRGKLEEAQKCNQSNHTLHTLLASLNKPVTKKD